MAVLNSIEPLREFIPNPKDKFFMSRIAHVPSKIVEKTPIFAVGVDDKLKLVTSLFRVEFSLFSTDESHYLFIGKAGEELTSETPFLKIELNDGKMPDADDWKFQTDEIGLFVITDTLIKKKLYFVTSHTDVKEIRDKIKNVNAVVKPKITVVTETVYI